MQLRFDPRRPEALPQQIQAALTQAKPPVCWLICADDPLMGLEVQDQLRTALKDQTLASSQSALERSTVVPDRSFDWLGWWQEASTPSLLASHRLIELRLPTGKPGKTGGKVLSDWAAAPPADTHLVVSLPLPDRTLQSAAWFQALSRSAAVIQLPRLGPAELGAWVSARLKAHGLSIAPEALAWVVHQCEGNPSAAQQLVLKLTLVPRQDPAAVVSRAEVEDLLTDAAKFSVFQVGDAVVQGPASRSLRVLRGLQEEGEPLPLVVWSVSQAVRRLPPAQSGPALLALARIDTMVKGLVSEDPWQALERLAMRLSPPPRTRSGP